MVRYDFLSGLNKVLEPQFWRGSLKQLFFVGPAGFAHFFTMWRQQVAKAANIKFTLLDPSIESSARFVGSSWLAAQQPQVVWGGDLTTHKNFNLIVKSTAGVAVWCCTAEQLKALEDQGLKDAQIIDLPKILTPKLSCEVAALLGFVFSSGRKELLAQLVNQLLQQPNLDLLLQICGYLEVVSPIHAPQLSDFVRQLSVAESRFFLLPNLLFSGEQKDFLTLWHCAEPEYPIPFWHSFWLNAFYRAIAVKQPFCSAKFAKSLGRLSENRYFKTLSIVNLQQAVWVLYQQEYNFKHGFAAGNLEPVFWTLWQ